MRFPMHFVSIFFDMIFFWHDFFKIIIIFCFIIFVLFFFVFVFLFFCLIEIFEIYFEIFFRPVFVLCVGLRRLIDAKVSDTWFFLH